MIKLAFSTLGCPDWTFEEIYSAAADLGFSGIEIRGMGKEIYAPRIREFCEELPRTREKLQKAGLEIPLFTSGANLSATDPAAAMCEAKEYVILCERAKVPYVRVLGDQNPQPGEAASLPVLAERFGEICDFARAHGVSVLVETNGVLADSAKMAELLDRTAADNLFVLWDVHHTYRFFHEAPEKTVRALGKVIRHVHLKDSLVENGQVRYKMMGGGDIPVAEAVSALSRVGYEGFYSLEWVKRWASELTEAGIVFPQFVSFMRGL